MRKPRPCLELLAFCCHRIYPDDWISVSIITQEFNVVAKLAPQDRWNRRVLESHPLYWPLLPGTREFVESFADWPALTDYQHCLNDRKSPILTRSRHTLTVVPQDETQQQFADGYEPRIYLKGELQTRRESWHDFFQVLVWKTFPKTKATINELHYNAIKSRMESSQQPDRRSVLENTLTQYDECGAVVISPDDSLLNLVKEFDWHTLFWKQRALSEQRLKCLVFGHAIYEKTLSPYIGMTGHAVLITVPEDIFSMTDELLVPQVDSFLENAFTGHTAVKTPQDLSPLPLLGFPGWHADNDQESFYHNRKYFRLGRLKKN